MLKEVGGLLEAKMRGETEAEVKMAEFYQLSGLAAGDDEYIISVD